MTNETDLTALIAITGPYSAAVRLTRHALKCYEAGEVKQARESITEAGNRMYESMGNSDVLDSIEELIFEGDDDARLEAIRKSKA